MSAHDRPVVTITCNWNTKAGAERQAAILQRMYPGRFWEVVVAVGVTEATRGRRGHGAVYGVRELPHSDAAGRSA